MTDLDKVIKGLECCSAMDGNKCSECPYAKECEEAQSGAVFAGSAHLCADALELLKAKESVKPIENSGFYYCGSCRYAFSTHRPKYCSECGKAVKWE